MTHGTVVALPRCRERYREVRTEALNEGCGEERTGDAKAVQAVLPRDTPLPLVFFLFLRVVFSWSFADENDGAGDDVSSLRTVSAKR